MSGPRLNPQLLKVPLYKPGKSEEAVKRDLGLDEVIKLASNESPVGPSPMAVAAAREILGRAHRYPGTAERELRQKLAEKADPALDAENFVTGNGGTDVLHLIAQAFVFDGGNCVMSRVTFPMYRISTTAFGGTVRQVEPTQEYRHDLAAMAGQIDDDTRIVYLCSPNNPIGDVISQAEADAFMAGVPEHTVIIFDESYHDFVTDPAYANSLGYVKKGRNVLILRSFSKSAGLAGMRVGYAIGPTELTNYIRRAQLPFHTSDIALVAAAASLDDKAFLARSQQAVIAGRKQLYDALSKMGLCCLPSQANYVVIIDPPVQPPALAEALMLKGYILRPMAAFGLPNGIRVSVGSQAENEGFIAALKELL